MLLSLYVSFRWARQGNYVLKTSAFVIMASLFSSYLGLIPFVSVLFGPFPLLSFPFYDRWDERRITLPQPYNYSDRISAYEIRFLAMAILQLVPQGPLEGSFDGGLVRVVSYRVVLLNIEIGSILHNFTYVLGTLFLFFFLANAVGALLGFLISKIQIVQKTEESSIYSLVRVVLGVAILLVGIWLSTIGEVKQTSPASQYYYDYDPYPYAFDAFAFIIFGVTWLASVLAERITKT